MRIVRGLGLLAVLFVSCTDEVPRLQPETCMDLYYSLGEPCPYWLFDRCALRGDPFDPRSCMFYEGFVCEAGYVQTDQPGCVDAGPQRDAGY